MPCRSSEQLQRINVRLGGCDRREFTRIRAGAGPPVNGPTFRRRTRAASLSDKTSANHRRALANTWSGAGERRRALGRRGGREA